MNFIKIIFKLLTKYSRKKKKKTIKKNIVVYQIMIQLINVKLWNENFTKY